ncbi:unnamed protein product [Paramecium primaurelia]|uniref:Transmembrane protein n=1 Tax=Paramecium primaurelia TaxID=5886 RepID=A0A8S1QRX1_PARPR|nr:unnamed protein product [Paramecium primaurelia]
MVFYEKKLISFLFLILKKLKLDLKVVKKLKEIYKEIYLLYNKGIYFKQSFLQRIALHLMEIFYYALKPFDSEWLLRNSQQEKNLFQISLIIQIIEIITFKYYSQQTFKISRIICYQRNSLSIWIDKQLTIPLKFSKQISKLMIKTLNQSTQMKIKTIFVKPLTIDLNAAEKEKNFKEELKHSTIDFLTHQIVDSDDKVHYFVLISHFLKLIRFHCKQNKEGQQSSEFVSIQAALQITQFNFKYSNLINESTQLRNMNSNYRIFFSVINVLFVFLMIVRELSLALEQTDRINSQILLQTIATQEIAKAISIGY